LQAGGLGALAGLAAACSSSTSTRHPSLGAGGSTTRVPPSDPRPSGARVVELGARHVAAGDVISRADARRFAPLIGGRWRGAWRDSSGGSGTSDLLIAVDAVHRSIRATVDVGGPILGAGSPLAPTTYEIDLLGFALDAASWTVTSPQLGRVVVTADGGVSLTATATDVPGHPEIAKIDITGTRLGRRVDGRYTITGTDGNKTTATMAWTSGGQRAAPPDPTSTTADSTGDVLSGQYAAGFGTAAALSAAVGRATHAALPNGGKIGYAPGIDISNANAATADGELVVQYSVYRGSSPARTADFWHTLLSGQPAVSGPWTAAFFQLPGTLYAYRGSRILMVNITPTVQAEHPPTSSALQPEVLAVAKALMRGVASG
jgi:hypothetical protein